MATRVLVLTQVLPYPPDSGPKIKTWNLLKCLSPQYEVTLVSFVRGDQSDAVRCLRDRCAAVHTVPIQRGWATDFRQLTRSLVTRQPFFMVRDDQGAMRRLVDQVVAETRFDIAHADQLNMAQYAARVPGARKILDAHNALWLLYDRFAATRPPGPVRWLYKREAVLLKRYEGRACRAADAVMAVNSEDRAALEEAAGGDCRIHILPITVDSNEVAPVARRFDADHVVHIGTMYWPPNVDGIIWFAREVWPLIRARRPSARLDVIGARPPRGVVALSRNASGINVTGYVEDVSSYLEKAGVFIVPLRAGGGMRVKILNALAQGLPVVSTSIGCQGIAVESGRHLLIADSARAFADETVRVLDDHTLAATLGSNGRQLVKAHYDYRVVCPQALDLYRRALDGQQAGVAGGGPGL